MSIEFFTPECHSPVDADGYEILRSDLLADELIECGINDPEFGEPGEWPPWVDADRWELGLADLNEEAARPHPRRRTARPDGRRLGRLLLSVALRSKVFQSL